MHFSFLTTGCEELCLDRWQEKGRLAQVKWSREREGRRTVRDRACEKLWHRKRERKKERRKWLLWREGDGGGGEVVCVNTQEHCIKPMHCSEAGWAAMRSASAVHSRSHWRTKGGGRASILAACNTDTHRRGGIEKKERLENKQEEEMWIRMLLLLFLWRWAAC